MLFQIVLAFGLDDDFDGYLLTLQTGASILFLFAVVAVLLIGGDWLDRVLRERNSPVEKAWRKRHFGGV